MRGCSCRTASQSSSDLYGRRAFGLRATETVLVVDDDEAVCVALGELLESEGLSWLSQRTAVSRSTDLERGLRPCAVVLDLMMPIMDGWDFRAEQIRNRDLKDVPVVIITAAGFSAESMRAQFGVLPFIPKPLDPDALLATVRRACRHCGAKTESIS